MINVLSELFERDLRKLAEEIKLYQGESDMWEIRPGIANSAGNLCLHLIGNLQYFIGAVLGNSGYIRQRELEFSQKNIPKNQLLVEIENTISRVKKTLNDCQEADLEQTYPLEREGRTVTTGYMLAHLLSHLNYHLGQVNYHRRLIQ
ncbi:MAG: DinB family protein [Saprospiraceae bacterium]|nr:DinB family protein [Saprospiraceae bacterium]